jgi:hypothetical protein
MINIPTPLPEQALPLILVPDNEIRNLAYLLWEREGRQESDGVDYWVEAERRLRQEKAFKRFIASPNVIAELTNPIPGPAFAAIEGHDNLEMRGAGRSVLCEPETQVDAMEIYNQQLGAPSEQEDFEVFTDRSFLSGAQVKSIKQAVRLSSATALARIEEPVEA